MVYKITNNPTQVPTLNYNAIQYISYIPFAIRKCHNSTLKVTILLILPKSKWSKQEWIPKLYIHEQLFSQNLSVSFSFFTAHSTLNHV